MPFQTPLITHHVASGRKFLESPLVYYSDDTGLTIEVPTGFYSDGASVPRPLWALYPPFGEAYEPAAWLHDYLYVFGKGSRKEADEMFLEAMKDLGFRKTGRYTVYLAVRAGGWVAWNRYRRERCQ